MKMLQTKTISLLSFAQLCKFFSHFGMRTLLVLYMTGQLHYSDTTSFGVNAVFCALVELAGIFGGIIADRYLGLKKTLLAGSLVLSIGYMTFFFDSGLFWGMGLVITGSGLFSSNLTALFGAVFEKNDPNRKKGFTLFYLMQNLGALISMPLIAFIADRFGFSIGLIAASLGMLMATILLFAFQGLLPSCEEKPKAKTGLSLLFCALLFGIGTFAVYVGSSLFVFLPWLTSGVLLFFLMKLLKDDGFLKREIYTLCIFLFSIILFFGVEDQILSSLLLFAERMTNHTLFNWTIPSSIITSVNPLIILLCGSLLAKKEFSLLTPFLLTAIPFGALALFCLFHLPFSLLGLMGVVSMISLAELMIGPLVYSKTSEIAAKGRPGMIMGMLPIAFSLAFQLSGGLSKLVATDTLSPSLKVYSLGFGKIALLLLLGGFVMHLLMRRLKNEKSLVC